MTQVQLQNLIKNSLGPIVDAAIRTFPQEKGAAALAEYLAWKAKLDASQIDQSTFDAETTKMIRRWSSSRQLAFYIAFARNNGDLPAASTGFRGDLDWPSSDWATIVTS